MDALIARSEKQLQSSQGHTSLLVLVRRAARRWKPGALVFAVSFFLIAAVALLLPNEYESHLKVLVKNERIDPLIGTEKQTQGVLYSNDISEARINTEIQLLMSSDVLRDVVQRSHLVDTTGTSRQPAARREEVAMRRLQKDLSINVIRNSNVIEATYESKDPYRAAEVLRNLSQAYMRSHRTVHGVPGSYEFFQRVSAKYSADLSQAEDELAKFSETNHIVTMPEQKSLALSSISRLEVEMQETSASAAKNGRTVTQLKRQIATLPEVVERGRRSLPNQGSVEQLNTLLVGLQNKRSQAAYRYQPEDRVIKELDAQIKQTETAIAAAQATPAAEISLGANPAMDAARAEYVRAEAEEAGDLAKAGELQQEVDADQSRLVRLDAQSVAYRRLTRKVTDLEELDQNYRKRTDEARMAAMLDDQRISNLAVIEEPFVPQLASSPKRGLILAVGLLWSLALGCATAVGLELATDRIYTPFSLEQATGVPVLAALPSNAAAPFSGGAFPELYLAMRRPSLGGEDGAL